MPEVRRGKVEGGLSPIWSVIDDETNAEAGKFDSRDFFDLIDGIFVYYVLPEPFLGFIQNVQGQVLVDLHIACARPNKGFSPSTEQRLRRFIMDKLLTFLNAAKPERPLLQEELVGQLAQIQEAAELLPSQKVTDQLLDDLEIPA